MSFFNIDPNELPEANYFFNIFVINIAVRESANILNKGLLDYWSIEAILEPRPYVIHFYIDNNIPEDYDWLIESYSHCVLEIHPTLGVSWYDMIDFDTYDPWDIDSSDLYEENEF